MEYGKKYVRHSLILGTALLIGSQMAYADNAQLLTMQELDSVTAGAAAAAATATAFGIDNFASYTSTGTATNALSLASGGAGVAGAGAGAGAGASGGTASGQNTAAAAAVSPTPYGTSGGNSLSITLGGVTIGGSVSAASGVYF